MADLPIASDWVEIGPGSKIQLPEMVICALDLKAGDVISFNAQPDGTMIVTKREAQLRVVRD